MSIELTDRFLKDVTDLSKSDQEHLFRTLLKLKKAVKNWHEHGGVGLRKIHASGIFEARLGLNLRMIFGYRGDHLILHRIGSHDDVKKYLKNL